LLLFFMSIFLISPNVLTLVLFISQFILISIQIRIEEQHLTSVHNKEITLTIKRE
jgi:protein-S-isoprenylcysteine O-methyltransferase Ste14